MLLASLLGWVSPGRANAAGAPEGLSEEARWLSQRWAPTFAQEISSRRPEQDRPLRVDFDGDWDATNNWQHLTPAAASKRPAVYGSAVLTETHAFLTYTLFFPRDWAAPLCLPYVCHDNDLESILVVAERGVSGALVLVETKAHRSYHVRSPTELVREADGRPLLRVESQGHGIYPVSDPRELDGLSLAHWVPPRGEPTQRARPERYELLDLHSTLWAHRGARAQDGQLWSPGDTGFLAYDGARLGRLGGLLGASMATHHYPGGVRPPWALEAAAGERGDWFLDPAFVAVSQYAPRFGRAGTPASTRYVFHPYLADLRQECVAAVCPPSPPSPPSLASRLGITGALVVLLGIVSSRFRRPKA